MDLVANTAIEELIKNHGLTPKRLIFIQLNECSCYFAPPDNLAVSLCAEAKVRI